MRVYLSYVTYACNKGNGRHDGEHLLGHYLSGRDAVGDARHREDILSCRDEEVVGP
jgi:hypothetical protein